MAQELERRVWPVTGLEMRAAEEPGEFDRISGYAAVFDSLSVDLGGFRERIMPGAFTRSIKDGDVRALWEHNPQYVLGRNRAGTLQLAEDTRGLKVEIYPPATVWAGDLRHSLERGDVNQMSFGFYVRQDEWTEEDGVQVRVLRDVDLFDVSVVTYPAYPQTSAEARATAELRIQQSGPTEEEAAERARTRARRAARQRRLRIETERLR